ncbi:helix-turn-helix domain-containing protein [Halobacterium wangiae]|uniref:helix-turn-helix domain-containing protein n=1 Tax=Halobacterium wangiae TaxID=2902623 RepID=UPI001E529578|nr:helix-turn-helix domain-containing protein [Halobacterium wangiae]
MKHMRVRLGFPRRTRHPMHNFLVDHPEMRRQELWSWSFVGELPTVLFRAVGDVDAYRERIADVDSVQEFDLTPVTDSTFYSFVYAEPSESEWEWMLAFYRASIVVMPPIVYTDDGEAIFEVLGDPADLRGMLAEFPDRIDTTVERVGEYDRFRTPAAPLTDRQREVVETATELGYYEVPREATLDDVAAELDVAASTVSDHLRKAEAEVMGALM